MYVSLFLKHSISKHKTYTHSNWLGVSFSRDLYDVASWKYLVILRLGFVNHYHTYVLQRIRLFSANLQQGFEGIST